MTVPVSALQEVAPGAIIELFELQLNTTQHGVNDVFRFHAGTSLNNNGNVYWNGNQYIRFPIEADGFEYSGNGQLPRPKIRVSNILSTITAILLTLPDGLEGAKVTRIRTLARYIDAVNFPGGVSPYSPDPTAEFPREIYYVDRKTIENRDVVEFELAAAFDLAGVRAPKRQCIANICQWKYRSAECGYAGTAYFDDDDNPVSTLAADVCSKRLTGCEARFKSFSRIGSVTAGSNQLVMAAPISVSVGDPIFGHGIASGTTVSSVSANNLTVTMSANATASNTATKTGTIQANRTQLIVSNTTGLAIGMTVTGSNIPANTTIIGISGTTLTLSQPANQIYSLVKTVSGQIRNDPVLRLVVSRTEASYYERAVGTYLLLNILETLTGLSIGMLVMGSGLPADYTTTIVSLSPYRNWIELSYASLATGGTKIYSFYTVGSYLSASYTFTGSSNYVFRNPATDALPFGSYPGVGTFFG